MEHGVCGRMTVSVAAAGKAMVGVAVLDGGWMGAAEDTLDM